MKSAFSLHTAVTSVVVFTLFLSILVIATPSDSEAATKRLTSVCKSRQNIGWLYKPKSEDTNDVREGKPALLFTKYKPTKNFLRVYAANGTQICRFKYYRGSEAHGRRFYSGTGCNRGGSQILAAAKRAARSNSIYIEGGGATCVGPITPTNRADYRTKRIRSR